MKPILTAAAVAIALAGCAMEPPSGVDPTAVPIDIALDDPNREGYYLRDMREWIGSHDIDVSTRGDIDDQLIEMGYLICDLFDLGVAKEIVADTLMDGDPSKFQFAVGAIGASTVWLCPEHV